MNNSFGVMRSPRTILFGSGQRFALGKVAREIGTRALICTDKRLAGDAMFKGLVEHLHESGVETFIYDGTQAELPVDGVHECVAAARDFAPQLVVGIGGGSCMDMAKLVSLLLSHPGPLDLYYGEMKVPSPIIPVIAMPTTSGTGSEVTPVAVLADNKRDLKVGVSSPYLIPHTAICDPELTLTCPPLLTAYSGADALTHAIESFTSIKREGTPGIGLERVFVGKNPLADVHALTAISNIATYLKRSVADGSDIEARGGLMLGALHAGLAFGTGGTAAAHAIQYPVGALTHTAHAAGVAVLMPYVMSFNRAECTEEFAQIAKAMGVQGNDPEALADAAIGAVSELFRSVGIPGTLVELGMTEDKVDWVSAQSMLSARLVNNNPRLLDEQAMKQIVTAAMAGTPHQASARA